MELRVGWPTRSGRFSPDKERDYELNRERVGTKVGPNILETSFFFAPVGIWTPVVQPLDSHCSDYVTGALR
jgi:hypothetical protein